MQKGSYIYYHHRSGNTMPGCVLKFNRDFTRAKISYDNCLSEKERITTWVSINSIEVQRHENEIELKGITVTVSLDFVHYKGEPVKRFDAPCTCRPVGTPKVVAALGFVIVASEDDCPVHGFGEMEGVR